MRPSFSRSPAAHSAPVRLVALMLLALFMGVLALVQHTRVLAAAHGDVIGLFETGGGGNDRGGNERLGNVTAATTPATPVGLCEPTASGLLGMAHTELWGDVVPLNGQTVGGAASAAECCRLCASSKSCNTWVWCADAAVCSSQCWLKRQPTEAALLGAPHGTGPSVPWTSGVLLGKALDVAPGDVPPEDGAITAVALHTSYGAIRLRLRPDWSNASVTYIRALAAQPELCTDACAFYRVEPAFLLQGSLRSRIPPNQVTTPGPRHMVRGDCGWAGGSAGPDFFCYLGTGPATHWGLDHTVWAEIADDASFAVAETINALPPKPTKPGEMHLLPAPVPLDVRVA
jgi:hypothetical protein